MDSTRAKDWLIGAAGMLLVLGVAVAILWGVVSDPAGEGGEGPMASPTADAGSPPGATADAGSPPGATADARRPPGAEPPADLLEGEVWFADLALDSGTVVTAGSVLHDVRAVGQDVVTGPDGMAAARLTVDATVPFEAVAEELGDGTVVRAADGGQAMVVRTVEALGRELRVTATGTVEVEAGKVVVEPRSIDIGGPDFLSDAIAAVVRRFVTIEHEIEGLPKGLVLQDVAVQEDGFRANLQGEDVLLGQ